jgi:hypothetical protein
MWKFGKVPKGYWQDDKNVKDFLDDISKEFNINRCVKVATLTLSALRSGTELILVNIQSSGVL